MFRLICVDSYCYPHFLYWRCTAISDLFINEQIRDREVRVIGQDGEQLGIMPPKDAMKIAREAGVDLVKIAPTAKPPVCKIVDYGKYKYEQLRKRRKPRKSRRQLKSKKLDFLLTLISMT